jgi:hypothetical protein
VDEPENGIEARAIIGLRLPGDDFPAQGFEHLAAFGYEIGNQVIHRRKRPQQCFTARYAGEELTLRYPCPERSEGPVLSAAKALSCVSRAGS